MRAGSRLLLKRGLRRYGLLGIAAVDRVLILDRESVWGLVSGILMRSMTLLWLTRKGYVLNIWDENHYC